MILRSQESRTVCFVQSSLEVFLDCGKHFIALRKVHKPLEAMEAHSPRAYLLFP